MQQEVKTTSEQATPNLTTDVEKQKSDVIEHEVIEEEVVIYDKDEESIAKWVESGEDRITTSQLIKIGVDMSRVRPFGFRIGKYSFQRTLLVSAYYIEVNDKVEETQSEEK